jgi:tRNA dimethylallyltransferase
MSFSTNVIVLCGPTASSKSKIAFELSKLYDSVIINADSMQIYKEFPILTGQPLKETTNKVSHKLYGFVKYDQEYSVFHWFNTVKSEIESTKKNIIIIGGTGLYITCLLNGMIDNNDNILKLTSLTDVIYNKNNLEYLTKFKQHNTNINDTYRILRDYRHHLAYRVNKMPQYDKIPEIINAKIFYIKKDRHFIRKKAEINFLNMIEQGAIGEVKNYLKSNNNPKNKIIGIKPIIDYLDNKITKDKMISLALNDTNKYIKRQYTWFNNQLPNHTIILNDLDDNIIINKINNYIL